jgi:hypothetical protein
MGPFREENWLRSKCRSGGGVARPPNILGPSATRWACMSHLHGDHSMDLHRKVSKGGGLTN